MLERESDPGRKLLLSASTPVRLFFLTLKHPYLLANAGFTFLSESLLATRATTKRSLNLTSEEKETPSQQDFALKWEKCQRLH